MADPMCSQQNCEDKSWNLCGKCGCPTCKVHSIEDDSCEEGYICFDCAPVPAKLNHLRVLLNDRSVRDAVRSIPRRWGEVMLRSGGTQTKCERCNQNFWEVSVRTRDEIRHKFCECCLGMIVESYLEHQASPESRVVRVHRTKMMCEDCGKEHPMTADGCPS